MNHFELNSAITECERGTGKDTHTQIKNTLTLI